MNDLILSGSNTELDSREIAELTEKRHANVVRDIRTQLQDQGINELNFESVYYDRKNEKRILFKLDYEQTMILISGYFIKLRAKIIKRWNELENKNKPSLPSYVETLRLYANEIEKNEQLKLSELQNAPKVQLAEKCLRSSSDMSITDAGKHLNISQKDIFKIMRDNGYLTRKNLPTQKALNREVLSVRSDPYDGVNWRQAVMNMSNIMNFQKRHLKGVPVQRELLGVRNE